VPEFKGEEMGEELPVSGIMLAAGDGGVAFIEVSSYGAESVTISC
jgi:hypothetical protein